MARDTAIADALAALLSAGIELTDAQKAKVEELARTEMTDAARTVFANKLSKVDGETSKVRNGRVQAWAERMMTLAADFANDVPGTDSNRGQGTRKIRMVRVETPQGSLKVELSSDADDETDADE